jgi:hypothetical protein
VTSYTLASVPTACLTVWRLRGCRAYAASDLSSGDGSGRCGVDGRRMSLITLRPTPSCAACAAVTLLPFPSNSELSTSSVNLFQHSRATLGNYLLLHRIHLHSRIFAPLYFLSLSLYPSNSSASIPLRLQCPSRISDLLYLISQQLLHSTYLLFSPLDTATSAARAIPSALESTTPTSSSLRDLGGEPDYQD